MTKQQAQWLSTVVLDDRTECTECHKTGKLFTLWEYPAGRFMARCKKCSKEFARITSRKGSQ